MSLVPYLLNDLLDDYRRPMVGDLYDQNFGHHPDFGHHVVPHPHPLHVPLRSGYVRPWRSMVPHKSGVSTLKNDEHEFSVNLDVQQFKPDELKVTVDDNHLIVEGKHQERTDEHGYISRHFTRRYRIPEDVDQTALVSKLSSDGVLTLCAPKKIVDTKARVIPITHTNQPLKIDAAAKKPEETKKTSEKMES